MLAQIFQAQAYAFNSHALPLFAAAGLILFMSALTLTHERGSRVAVPLFLMALATAFWLVGFGVMYCARTTAAALWWARFAHAGIVFIPTAALYFAARVVGKSSFAPGRSLTFAASVSAMFLVLAFVSPEFIIGMQQHWWGQYPRYGAIGSMFIVFLVLLVTTCIIVFFNAMRCSPRDTALHRRSKLFLVASCVGAASVVDFMPMYGLDVFPIGKVTMLCLFAITTYVTWRYRLVDLTPSFVGQQITDTMTDALIVMDRDGIIRLTNEATCRLLGREEEEMVGETVTACLGESLGAHLEQLAGGEPLRDIESTVVNKDGQTTTISLSASMMHDRYRMPVAFVYTLRDISHRKRAEDRIRQLAYFDDLTSLPNRTQSNEQLHRCLEIAAAENIPVATLFIDLDRFKRINDTLGHSAGDVLLRQVAERLRGCVRECDLLAEAHPAGAQSFVARLGGDEFIICLFDVSTQQDIDRVARRILAALSDPFQLGKHEVFITASIGVSRFPDDGCDVQSLLKNADTAMYRAKDNGRDNFMFYDAAMSGAALERLSLEADLRKALDREEFTLAYQPQVDQESQQIFGAEALLRWHHPTRGMVSPGEFIPLAEETGLIAPIGEWVLAQACHQTALWHQSGFDGLTIAVNLSERQFRRNNLLQVVANALRASGMSPDFLDLELTESIIMQNAAATIETLEALKLMGIKISVDDFGTGYSSLSYLKRFPIDVLKVDGSFIREVATNTDDAAITSAIIAMARSLKLDVIAEGVETIEQMEFLRGQGCHRMQGYMFGRPMSAEQFGQRLREQAETAASAEDTGTVLAFTRPACETS
ncbi:MAG: EAL domain-containing protein [Gammaproteobacteria bacterium]|nr:EAL domain-containing protein [Gammaproteobacteria bacterium]NNF61393.1 EAL domain-containing protein [Gammaproteobacteria bacterium]